MKCPSCSNALSAMKVGDFSVDACTRGCGGIWLDRSELDKIDENSEFPSDPILKLAKEKESVKVDPNKLKHCPKCAGEVLVRQFIDVKNQVEIDQCWSCSGLWLDSGELNTIRNQYASYSDRAKAVNDYVDANIATTAEELKRNTSIDLARYNDETSNRFKAGIHAFKKILGL